MKNLVGCVLVFVGLPLAACSTPEKDPVFSGSPAGQTSPADIDNWNASANWGNHAEAGYLKTESDPLFGGSPASGITSSQLQDWTTAHQWGDHAAAGYLTAESDPLFGASAASTIASADVANWNQAYGWGSHTTAGYLTAESDPAFTSSVAALITSVDTTKWTQAYDWGNHADAGYLSAELDPAFASSAAASITNADKTGWTQAFTWGNHADAGYLRTESDPVFTGSAAAAITNTDRTRWTQAFNWGNHADAGYLKTETDPIFASSPSGSITNTNKSNWTQAFGWGDHRLGGYMPATAPVAKSASYQLMVRAASRGWSTAGDQGVWINGALVLDTQRSIGLVAINRATGAVQQAQHYDVFGSIANADALAATLNSYGQGSIVIITTFDEPFTNRLGTSNALRQAIIRCGGTAEQFENRITYRGAYLMVGICAGGGRGSALELLAGTGADPNDAAVEANFKIVDGNLRELPPQVVNLAPTTPYVFVPMPSTYRSIADLSYSFVVSRPTLVQVGYSIGMVASGGQLLTRLEVVGPSGTFYPVEARALSGGGWHNNAGAHSAVFGPGFYTVGVQYRLGNGDTNDPSAVDYEHRRLTFRLDRL